MGAEKNFENHVKEYLTLQGAYFIKYWAGAQYTKAGTPDILACIGGVFFGIELKSKTGKASELQKYNIRQINKAGGVGVILKPDGIDDFKELVEEVQKCDGVIAKLSALKAVHTNTNCDILTI